MGDSAIGEDEVTHARRGDRAWNSRLIDLPPRQQHQVTVIAGPHEEPCRHCDGSLDIMMSGRRGPCGTCDHGKVKHACILYTAFGGPLAPQEPGDVRGQLEEVERKRYGLSDLSDEHKALTAQILVLREKRAEADKFWSGHAGQAVRLGS